MRIIISREKSGELLAAYARVDLPRPTYHQLQQPRAERQTRFLTSRANIEDGRD